MAKRASIRPSAVIEEARTRWQRAAEAEDKQRKSILLAKQFRAGDQWEDSVRVAREGGNAIAGQPAQPPRPCLTVDRLSQPLRQLSNMIRNARFGFDVQPNGGQATEEVADIFKGYLRRVMNEARADGPVEWAADGAGEGGIGWFRILTAYTHENWVGEPSEDMYDQELQLGRIANNLTVYCDPTAVRPTRSDAQFMFVTEDMDREYFKQCYPDADVAGLDGFAATGDCPKEWVTKDTIRIAEYWRVEYEKKDIYMLEGGGFGEGAPPKDAKVRFTRTMRVPIVKGSKINAFEELEPMAWVGSRIPLVPVLGEEINVDGQMVLRGVIQQGMDAQRMINYTYSGAMEIFALAPKSPILAAAPAVEQYKNVWQKSNTVNFAYLPWDPYDDQGRQMPKPERELSEAPIQAAVALMRVSEDAVRSTTNFFEAALGEDDPQHRSGRALQQMQGQTDLATSHYPDNVRRAVIYAADLMIEVIPKITRPGQILHILGEDNAPQQVMVGQPFQMQNGAPVASPPDITPEIAKLSQGLHQFYDLNNGTYSVTVTLGKAFSTKREESAAALAELIPHLPPPMQAIATPEFVKQLSFPGSQELAAKLQATLPPMPDELKDLPPAAQAMVMGLQQQLQQAQQAIATKAPELQAKMQQTQMSEQHEDARAQLDAQTQLQKAEISATATMSAAQAKVDAENFRSYVDAMETRLAHALDLHMQKTSEVMGKIHEAVQNTADRLHEVQMAKLDQQHALEQGAQQAALAPAPSDNGAGA